MKPKHLKFAKRAFPALIVVPAMIQMVHAATIQTLDPTTGNITVGTDYPSVYGVTDSDHTIVGDSVVAGLKTITVDPGVNLTGDAGYLSAVSITQAEYHLLNSGELSGQSYA